MTVSIARLHVLGATIWAYAAGAVSVSPWDDTDGYHRLASEVRRRA
jgi:hypothetical protein